MYGQHDRRGIFVLQSAIQIAKGESLSMNKTMYLYQINNGMSGVEYSVTDKSFITDAVLIGKYKNGVAVSSNLSGQPLAN